MRFLTGRQACQTLQSVGNWSRVTTKTARNVSTTGKVESDGMGRTIRLAVLHQALEPPVIGGVKKAKKPGGYQDSSADIAYVIGHLAQQSSSTDPKVEVVTPKVDPEPTIDQGWSFQDTESSILSAVNDHKATHFWANTILFSDHPMQASQALDKVADDVYMVGQPPQLVEKYDDKNWVNDRLRMDPSLKLPKSWIISLDSISSEHGLQDYLEQLKLPYPVIGKPIRGRGSHGVKLCRNLEDLTVHLKVILGESPQIMIEEFLAGQEGTVTVMPPSKDKPRYWSLPVVERFNHADGVAPYNGIVAVIANSRVTPLDVQDYKLTAGGDVDLDAVLDAENAYVDIRRQCNTVAEKLGCTAPIRIDVRRKKEGEGTASENPFVMFDVNMKPNMTGPGRPGRENQASLTALAAEALGWDYAKLLQEILKGARPLSQIRRISLSEELR